MILDKLILALLSKNTYRGLSLLIGFIFCIQSIHASLSFSYRTFSENDGLSHGQITHFVQDRQGYIWLSTWNGLNMFDGQRFHVYKANPGDTNPLVSNRIDQIYLTTTDNLWCVTQNNDHVYLFNRDKNCFDDLLLTDSIDFQLANIYPFRSGYTWLVDKKNIVYSVNDTTFETKTIPISLLEKDRIYRIFSDNRQNKWIMTSNGLFVYNPFIDVLLKKTDRGFSQGINFGNDLFLACKDSLFYYDHLADSIIELNLKYKLDGNIEMLTRSARGELAIGGMDQLILYNTVTKQDTLLELPRKGFKIKRFRKDKQGNYWGVTEQGAVLKMDAQTNQPSYHFEEGKTAKVNTQLLEDQNGWMWIVTKEGHLYYHNEDGFNQFLHTGFTDDSENYIRRLFVDNENNIWTVFYRGFGIVSLQLIPYMEDLKEYNIRCLKKDRKGDLWIATKEGYLIKQNQDAEKQFLDPKGRLSLNKTQFSANIYCMYFDEDDNLWLGTKDKGLYVLQKNESNYYIRSFTHSAENKFSLSDNSVYSICADPYGGIWIGTFGGGINKVVYEGLDDMRFLNYNNELTRYPKANRKVRNMEMLSATVMGVATTDGMVTFDVDNVNVNDIAFHVNTRKPGQINSLSDNNLINLSSDGLNRYAVTYNGGLNRIMSNDLLCDTIKFELYGINKGAASEIGLSALQINDSIVWVCYESALSFLNLHTNQFANFRNDIFGRNILFSECGMVYENDILSVASNRGIISLDTKQLEVDSNQPPVMISSISIRNKAYKGNPDRVETIVLNPKERNLTVSFVAVSYKSVNDKTEYAIMMEGMTDEWEYIGSSNTVTFSNISPGEYQLKIRATNSNGIWSDAIRSIHILAKPAFHETYWAKVLYVVLIILLFILGRRVFYRAKQIMLNYRKALEEARQKRLSASLTPNYPEAEPVDRAFLEKLLSIVEENISNTEFTVDELSSLMAMGKTNFYKKIKELLGQTPVDFIREIRIKRAMQLLKIGQMNVTEVAYACGFSDPKFFSKTFKKMIGVSPTEFKNSASKPSDKEKDTICE